MELLPEVRLNIDLSVVGDDSTVGGNMLIISRQLAVNENASMIKKLAL